MSRHDYDHAAAFVIYLELRPPNRTYAEVARKVGCNPATVAKWAAKYDWDGQLEAAVQREVEKHLKSEAQLSAQNARIYGKLLDLSEKRIDAGDATDEFVARMLAQTSKDFRLNADLATDNIAIGQVQEGFRVQQAAAYELLGLVVEEGLKGRAILVAFRERLPALVAERLALIGGSE